MRSALILVLIVGAALVTGAGASLPTLPDGFTIPPTTLPMSDPAVPTTVVTPVTTVSGNQLQVVSTQLDPQVLARGFAWLSDMHGRPISTVAQAPVGAALQAHLTDGQVDVTVVPPRLL